MTHHFARRVVFEQHSFTAPLSIFISHLSKPQYYQPSNNGLSPASIQGYQPHIRSTRHWHRRPSHLRSHRLLEKLRLRPRYNIKPLSELKEGRLILIQVKPSTRRGPIIHRTDGYPSASDGAYSSDLCISRQMDGDGYCPCYHRHCCCWDGWCLSCSCWAAGEGNLSCDSWCSHFCSCLWGSVIGRLTVSWGTKNPALTNVVTPEPSCVMAMFHAAFWKSADIHYWSWTI